MSCSVSSSHIRTWMVLPSLIQWKMSSILSSSSSSCYSILPPSPLSRLETSRCWEGARCCQQHRPTRQPWDPLTTFLSRHPNPPTAHSPEQVWLVLAYVAHLSPLVQPPPLSHQPGGSPASQARWAGCEGEERSWVRGGGAQATDPHWGKKALCAAWRRTGEPHTHFCGRDVLHKSHKHENTTNTQRKIHTRAHTYREKTSKYTHLHIRHKIRTRGLNTPQLRGKRFFREIKTWY